MAQQPSDADALLRRAARPERLWPWAVVALVLYLLGSTWGFTRLLGTSGQEAHVQASPTVWAVAAVLAVVVAARLAGSIEAKAGGSPWRWPRLGRRALVVLMVALPLLAFGAAPVAAVMTVDQGRTDLTSPLSLVVDVTIAVR